MPTIDDTACTLAWDWLIIKPEHDQIQYCCRTLVADITSDSTLDVFNNHSKILDARRNLLLGNKTVHCSYCWKLESAGNWSPRTGIDELAEFIQRNHWSTISTDEIKQKLRSLTTEEVESLIRINAQRWVEIFVGDTCDLKCMYCGPEYSTQWQTELFKYDKIIPIKKSSNSNTLENFKEWFSLNNTVEIITLIGGEPLIMDNFYKWFEFVIEHYKNNSQEKNIVIRINTNLNTPDKYLSKFISLCDGVKNIKFLKIEVLVSLDAIGKKKEFIRTNLDWQVFNNNLRTVAEYIRGNNNIELQFINTVNLLNITSLRETFEYITSIEAIVDKRIKVIKNQVLNKKWIMAWILTHDYIKYIDGAIEYLQSKENMSYYIEFLNSIKTNINNQHLQQDISAHRIDFYKTINEMAIRRNLNFLEVFPEMKDFYLECETLSKSK